MPKPCGVHQQPCAHGRLVVASVQASISSPARPAPGRTERKAGTRTELSTRGPTLEAHHRSAIEALHSSETAVADSLLLNHLLRRPEGETLEAQSDRRLKRLVLPRSADPSTPPATATHRSALDLSCFPPRRFLLWSGRACCRGLLTFASLPSQLCMMPGYRRADLYSGAALQADGSLATVLRDQPAAAQSTCAPRRFCF